MASSSSGSPETASASRAVIFQPGDMVIRSANPEKKSGFIAHYGVVSEPGMVIHKMPGEGVIEERMAPGEWMLKSRHGPLAAQTARAVLQAEKSSPLQLRELREKYNLVTANCENFARYCCQEKHVSYQVSGFASGGAVGAASGAWSGAKTGCVKSLATHAFFGCYFPAVGFVVGCGFLFGGFFGRFANHTWRGQSSISEGNEGEGEPERHQGEPDLTLSEREGRAVRGQSLPSMEQCTA